MEKQIIRTRIRIEPEYWKKFKQQCIAEEKNYMDKLGELLRENLDLDVDKNEGKEIRTG